MWPPNSGHHLVSSQQICAWLEILLLLSKTLLSIPSEQCAVSVCICLWVCVCVFACLCCVCVCVCVVGGGGGGGEGAGKKTLLAIIIVVSNYNLCLQIPSLKYRQSPVFITAQLVAATVEHHEFIFPTICIMYFIILL